MNVSKQSFNMLDYTTNSPDFYLSIYISLTLLSSKLATFLIWPKLEHDLLFRACLRILGAFSEKRLNSMQSLRLLEGLLKIGCLWFLDVCKLSFRFCPLDSLGITSTLNISAYLKLRMVSIRLWRVLDLLWLLCLSLLLLL